MDMTRIQGTIALGIIKTHGEINAMKRLFKITVSTIAGFMGVFFAIVLSGLVWNAVRTPSYQGKPLYKLLTGNQSAKANNLTLNQLLSITPTATNSVTGDVTFEAPANFDAVSQIGELSLAVNGRRAEFQECHQATNGSCILIWNSIFYPPKQCKIQAMLQVYKELSVSRCFIIRGPMLQYYSSNLYQIDINHSGFTKDGWFFQIRTIESNATYSIEMRTTDGRLIKTIAGSTSNGEISEHWDLTDDNGNRYTNMDELDATYHIKLLRK